MSEHGRLHSTWRRTSTSNISTRRSPTPDERVEPRVESLSAMAVSPWARSRSPEETSASRPGPSVSFERSQSYNRSHSPAPSLSVQSEPPYEQDALEFNISEDVEDDFDRFENRENRTEFQTVGAQQESMAADHLTENIPVKRKLTTWDVVALIMNKMIGGGIFTTPGQVLLLTRSKNLSMGLWVVGGVYSMISFSIYLEYGLNFPFNGGDLIYLDEAWSKPELLATVLYSGFFISLGHNAGNAIVFAKYCLAAASTDETNTSQFDHRLITFIAILVLGLVCLLLYFSDRTGLALNRLLAYYKIGLLLTVFIAGATAMKHQDSGRHDWGKQDTEDSGSLASFDTLSAMIYVIYSYQGWENANYVTGEVKFAHNETETPKHVLRLGGFIAVGLTTTLYILGTAGYYMACTYPVITSGESDLGMGQYFATTAFGGHTTGFKVCIALSAFGNLIAVVYSNSKVKQCIGRQRILPFSDWLSQDDSKFGTPGPALFVHWLLTLPFIIAIPKNVDGYTFLIGMYSYTHLFVLIFVGAGVWRLRSRMTRSETTPNPGHGKNIQSAPSQQILELPDYPKAAGIMRDNTAGSNESKNSSDRRFDGTTVNWKWKFLTYGWFRSPAVALFVGGNLLLLGASAYPPHDGENGHIHRYWWLITSVIVFFASLIYWALLRSLDTSARHNDREKSEDFARSKGITTSWRNWTWGRGCASKLVGVEMVILKNEEARKVRYGAVTEPASGDRVLGASSQAARPDADLLRMLQQGRRDRDNRLIEWTITTDFYRNSYKNIQWFTERLKKWFL